jgi:hypothetical protein
MSNDNPFSNSSRANPVNSFGNASSLPTQDNIAYSVAPVVGIPVPVVELVSAASDMTVPHSSAISDGDLIAAEATCANASLGMMGSPFFASPVTTATAVASSTPNSSKKRSVRGLDEAAADDILGQSKY